MSLNYMSELTNKEKGDIAKTWGALDKFLANGKIIKNNGDKINNQKKEDDVLNGVNDDMIEKIKSQFNNMDDYNKFIDSGKKRFNDMITNPNKFNTLFTMTKLLSKTLNDVQNTKGIVTDEDLFLTIATLLLYAEDDGIIKIIKDQKHDGNKKDTTK